MRMYEKEGEKYQYKEQHRRERKIAIKKNKLHQKEMVLSVCFQMEMIHFTVKINFS